MGTPDGLVAALVRAQANFGPVVKAHINPHFKSKYADLSDLIAVVRPALNAEGIWLTQPLETDDDGRVRLFTRLEGHGDRRESCLPLHTDNMNPQQLLSTVTYYRRAELASMLGVAAEDDDDGNLAATAPARATYDPTVLLKAATTSSESVALAAATPPEKPLAAMTAGEMARYGEQIGVRVSGSKADILRQLEPIVQASTGAEPFEVTTNAPVSEGAAGALESQPETIPFNPVVSAADGSATARKRDNAAAAAVRRDEPT